MPADVGNALQRWRKDPVLFVRVVLGGKPDKWQAEFMTAVANNRRVSARSGRRVGKTTALTWLAIWFMMCFQDAKAIITAPAASQLADAFGPEFRKWIDKLDDGVGKAWNLKAEKFEFGTNFVTIRTARADSPESLQGINATNVLVLVDEAAGVADSSFQALSGSMGAENAHMVLTGNPNRASGYFYDTFHALADQWVTFHVNSEDSERVDRDWIQEMQIRYGTDSNPYRIHVLGEFPTGDDDTIIPITLIEAAAVRDIQVAKTRDIVWGLDVARFGDDRSCLAKRKGKILLDVPRTWRNLDLMQLCGAVVAEYESSEQKPTDILVDSIGMGAGVVDRLRELGLPVRGINVSESPALKGIYRNQKAELWYKAKAWFEALDCQIPNDETLKAELAMVRYKYASTGVAQVESKAEIKKRGIASPDVADAFVLTFAGDAATAAFGGRSSWKKALRRRIKGVV